MEDQLIEFEEKPKEKLHVMDYVLLVTFVALFVLNIYRAILEVRGDDAFDACTCGLIVGLFWGIIIRQVKTMFFTKEPTTNP